MVIKLVRYCDVWLAQDTFLLICGVSIINMHKQQCGFLAAYDVLTCQAEDS